MARDIVTLKDIQRLLQANFTLSAGSRNTTFSGAVDDNAVTVLAAPGVGRRIVVDSFCINGTVAYTIAIRSNTNTILSVSEVAAAGGANISGGPFYCAENEALTVIRTSGLSTVQVAITYHVETI